MEQLIPAQPKRARRNPVFAAFFLGLVAGAAAMFCAGFLYLRHNLIVSYDFPGLTADDFDDGIITIRMATMPPINITSPQEAKTNSCLRSFSGSCSSVFGTFSLGWNRISSNVRRPHNVKKPIPSSKTPRFCLSTLWK